MYCVLARYFGEDFFLILQPSCTSAGIQKISRRTKLCINTSMNMSHGVTIHFKLAKSLGLNTY